MLDETMTFGGYWTNGLKIYTQPSSHLGVTIYPYDDSIVIFGTTASGLFLLV